MTNPHDIAKLEEAEKIILGLLQELGTPTCDLPEDDDDLFERKQAARNEYLLENVHGGLLEILDCVQNALHRPYIWMASRYLRRDPAK
ncbi:hypothetical protein [Mycobacterium sp. E2989]|uniref:hypothetical protein n=1 Tax=Mycobacterium sp. E2989 TaxID=1834140 RepID=UPI0008016DF9|nr:hypothetical protein [Mycobacterium sp. E2989]OBH84389.1 hypothetical protein A5680_09675 [Mycobacterium sp. E2989]